MSSRVLSKGLIEIGERIRKRRRELCWSQEKLAEMADISLNTVSRIENGQSDMSIEVFKRLAESLSVSGSELLGDLGQEGGEWQVQKLSRRICYLEQEDKEVVLRTLSALIDAIDVRHE